MAKKHGFKNNRRQFLQWTALLPSVLAMRGQESNAAESVRPGSAKTSSFKFEDATIAELQRHMKSGAYTAEAITEKYLERIERVDKSGPAVNAVIEVNPDAVSIARALDAERRDGRVRGPLHGVPVLIKDNIGTADRMRTSAGSLALKDSTPSEDSTIARKLREAGAVILGKTNLSEWANFRSTHSTSGWSSRGGQTKNPYALDRNPCGSSSGSAAAVAASLAPVAVGTETNGSIICPSSACSVVGIKPTVGLVSRTGVIPISQTQDTAGPMAKNVTDAAILLEALSGRDALDGATLQVPPEKWGGFVPTGPEGILRTGRLGIARSLFDYDERILPLMEAAIGVLKDIGFTLSDPIEVPRHSALSGAESDLLLYEFKDGINRYLQAYGGPLGDLEALIDFNERNRAEVMPYFGQEMFERAVEKGPLTEEAYGKALETCARLTRQEGIDQVLAEQKLDAIVTVSRSLPWVTDLLNGDHSWGPSAAGLPAIAGYPHITVPMGYVFGLPVGISFYGAAFSEKKLIRIAQAYEQAARARRNPLFLPTADLTVR